MLTPVVVHPDPIPPDIQTRIDLFAYLHQQFRILPSICPKCGKDWSTHSWITCGYEYADPTEIDRELVAAARGKKYVLSERTYGTGYCLTCRVEFTLMSPSQRYCREHRRNNRNYKPRTRGKA